ncbi:MAG: DUF2786 domain-containing protein [Oscillospiraceae bacterium]|jgi:hypothetical protein|nr:DUF2786 domain-containing protein [Oscillospiraceae bacterium]
MSKAELLEKLRKIQALAERGELGEKENATTLLARLMREHGISEHEIDSDSVDLVWFGYSTKFEERLLSQTIYMVMGEVPEFKVDTLRGKSKKSGVKCTFAQRLEIEVAYNVYRAAFKEDLEILFRAFVSKNNIYPPPELSNTTHAITPLDGDDRDKMIAMARGIDKSEIRKLIEGGE